MRTTNVTIFDGRRVFLSPTDAEEAITEGLRAVVRTIESYKPRSKYEPEIYPLTLLFSSYLLSYVSHHRAKRGKRAALRNVVKNVNEAFPRIIATYLKIEPAGIIRELERKK